jgi:tetratricopeptide (TPR) repeat protein
MNYLIKFVLCWIIPNLCFPSLNAQTLDETIVMAEQEIQTGNYWFAHQLFQRVLCFGNQSQKHLAYLKSGVCFNAIHNYEKAYENFEMAYNTASDDSSRNECIFQKTNTLLLQQKYNLALSELFDIKTNSSNTQAQRKELYMGLTFFLLENYSKSEEVLTKFIAKNCSHLSDSLQKIFIKNSLIKQKKIRQRQYMSIFIPGLGQTLAGNWKNGLNAFILNSSLLSLTIYIGINFGWFGAIASFSPWFIRYYRGNIKNAGKLTKMQIDKKREAIYEEILLLLGKCVI